MIEFDSISIGYKSHVVVSEFSMEMSRGTITWLQGSNASGKSTVLKCLVGKSSFFKGAIYINGDRIDPNKYHLENNDICYVPQQDAVFYDLTVSQNIEIVKQANLDVGETFKKNSFVSKFLGDNCDKLASELSGGLSKTLSLLMALLTSPKILLLDEPFAGVSDETSKEISSIILDFSSQGGCVLLAEHVDVHDLLPQANLVRID